MSVGDLTIPGSSVAMPMMPTDFCPDRIMVIGTYKDSELAFAISKTEMRDASLEYLLDHRLRNLRFALWQHAEHHYGEH